MKCGHCKGDHDTVQKVKDCYSMVSEVRTRPPTEKQINYAQSLIRIRETYGEVNDIEKSNSLEAACEHVNSLDFHQIKRFIDEMTNQPLREVKVKTLPSLVFEGMYRVGNDIFKVQRAVHGSGHVYAKRLTDSGFVFAPGVVSSLRPENRMTLQEAKDYGALYGTCCVCGRTLTNEQSIEDGIGPICAGKGWWSE